MYQSQLSEWFERTDVSRFLEKHSEGIEVELSFGKWDKERRRFVPGVTREEFYNLFSSLEEVVQKNPDIAKRKDIHTMEESSAQGVRRIRDFDTKKVSFLEKKRDTVLDETNWGLRFAMSREKQLEDFPGFRSSGFREKRRTSFVFAPKNAFKGLTVDMTKVVKSSHSEGIIYEVEIEIAPEIAKTPLSMTNAVKRILEFLQTFRSKKKNDPIPVTEKTGVLERVQKLLGSKRKGDTSFLNKPRSIQVEDLFEPRLWAITNKLDGERRLLYFGNSGTYIVNPPFDVYKIAGVFFAYRDTILDVEFYDGICYAFDCLWYSGSDKTHLNFDTRFQNISELEETIGEAVGLVSKKYFEVQLPLGSLSGIPASTKETRKEILSKFKREALSGDLLRRAVEKTLEYSEKQNFRTDGLILQPRDQRYKNEDTLKWKPEFQMTIDFRLAKRTDGNFTILMGKGREEVPFEGSNIHKSQSFVTIPKSFIDKNSGRDVEGEIVEFSFDKKKEKFVPERIRTDKEVPNYFTTATAVWKDIFSGVSLETLKGENLVLARRYNNITKGCLLEIPKERSSLLDVGGGRGGDIQKWMSLKYGFVKTIEPNPENMREMEKRAKKSKFSQYKVFNGKAQDTARVVKAFGKEELDSASIFFCLGYFGQKEKDLSGLISTLSILLKQGAMVMLAFMDGGEVRELLKDKKRFENSAFYIEKEDEFTDKDFGNSVFVHIKDETSMVKNQVEWLIEFPVFKRMMEDSGFELVFSRLMDEGISFLSTEAFEFVVLTRIAVFKKL